MDPSTISNYCPAGDLVVTKASFVALHISMVPEVDAANLAAAAAMPAPADHTVEIRGYLGSRGPSCWFDWLPTRAIKQGFSNGQSFHPSLGYLRDEACTGSLGLWRV